MNLSNPYLCIRSSDQTKVIDITQYSKVLPQKMSGFISLDGFVEESKDIVTVKQIDFHWGKLPYLPKTQVGKSEMGQLMDGFYKKQKAKALSSTQAQLIKNYNKLKRNMMNFAKKGETNFFNSLPEQSISLEPTPRIDLQKRYGNRIYPKLMAVKEAEQLVLSKAKTKKSYDNIQSTNLLRIEHRIKQNRNRPKLDRKMAFSTNQEPTKRSERELKFHKCDISWKDLVEEQKENLKKKSKEFREKTRKTPSDGNKGKVPKSIKLRFSTPKSYLFEMNNII